ncbi:hypothetical protein JAAARDRAFT_60558 [Jaapia argillacea MUCL 33604]|uniref:Glycosyltransferase family 1 protein n=1 Tax=Jaapia argillacea MUCL 33604 TaxID=933084 RepID=A0A067PIG1_9AGAM|nr:hypothetical protein JAAARDRAFT_60558 [Jaapia argillacea MUCL 33604]
MSFTPAMRTRLSIYALALVTFLTVFLFIQPSFLDSFSTTPVINRFTRSNTHYYAPPFQPSYLNVAVASMFPFHEDVYLPIVQQMESVLDPHGGRVQVYSPIPLQYGFQEIVDALELSREDIINPEEFMPALQSTQFGVPIDLVLLGTCEYDFRQWGKEMLAIWDTRPEDEKFEVACVGHNVSDVHFWREDLAGWAQRGVLRILAISEHVEQAYHDLLQDLGDQSRSADVGFEYVRTGVYVPILDLPLRKHRPNSRGVISQAVVQGFFDPDRRDYKRLFNELIKVILESPRIWGYQEYPERTGSFDAILDSSLPPFQLNLIGGGYLEVPPILKNVVRIHESLDYPEFYALMEQMDIVLPAFASNTYFDNVASSTVAMAIECNVPLLVTRRFRESYNYANDERVVVTRPQGLSEIEAIKLFRTHHFSPSPGDLPQYVDDVNRMLSDGWNRPMKGFETLKSEVSSRNEDVVRKMLSGE